MKLTIATEPAIMQAANTESDMELTIDTVFDLKLTIANTLSDVKLTIATEPAFEQVFATKSDMEMETDIEKLFIALLPGTAATCEGVCRSLRHAWTPGASDVAGVNVEALDFLFEFVLDPRWSLGPIPRGIGPSAIQSHLSRCVALGEEVLSIASRFVLHHCAHGCTELQCRAFDAQVTVSMARGRKGLQHVCNVAEAGALSELPSIPRAPPKASRAKYKAVSKRR
jgi:hypothetical protein